jgi:hypothetical protein
LYDDIHYIQAEIIWFDSILVDINDIDKLQKLHIGIGGISVWIIDIQYLLQIHKPVIFDNKIKISFPKSLFLDNNINNCITSIKHKDFIGIPLICLSYHKVTFEIISLNNTKYDLILSSVQINPKLKSEFTTKYHNMKIINHSFITMPYVIIKNISPFKFPLSNYDIINDDNIINYMNNSINKNIKRTIIKLPILINDLKNIIIEYLKIDCNAFNIIFENDLQYNYLMWFNRLNFGCGMGGNALSDYRDEDYLNSIIINI